MFIYIHSKCRLHKIIPRKSKGHSLTLVFISGNHLVKWWPMVLTILTFSFYISLIVHKYVQVDSVDLCDIKYRGDLLILFTLHFPPLLRSQS